MSERDYSGDDLSPIMGLRACAPAPDRFARGLEKSSATGPYRFLQVSRNSQPRAYTAGCVTLALPNTEASDNGP
jgi:hypothetical protein